MHATKTIRGLFLLIIIFNSIFSTSASCNDFDSEKDEKTASYTEFGTNDPKTIAADQCVNNELIREEWCDQDTSKYEYIWCNSAPCNGKCETTKIIINGAQKDSAKCTCNNTTTTPSVSCPTTCCIIGTGSNTYVATSGIKLLQEISGEKLVCKENTNCGVPVVGSKTLSACGYGCDNSKCTSAPTATGTCPSSCCGFDGRSYLSPHTSSSAPPVGESDLYAKCANKPTCGLWKTEELLRAKTCQYGCDSATGECKTVTPTNSCPGGKDSECDSGQICNQDTKKCEASISGGSPLGVIETIKAAVKDIACTVYCFVIGLVAAVAALVMMAAGLKYITSDDASDRGDARKRIIYAVLGLIIVIMACPIINLLFAGTVIDNGGVGPCACPCANILGGGSALKQVGTTDFCTEDCHAADAQSTSGCYLGTSCSALGNNYFKATMPSSSTDCRYSTENPDKKDAVCCCKKSTNSNNINCDDCSRLSTTQCTSCSMCEVKNSACQSKLTGSCPSSCCATAGTNHWVLNNPTEGGGGEGFTCDSNSNCGLGPMNSGVVPCQYGCANGVCTSSSGGSIQASCSNSIKCKDDTKYCSSSGFCVDTVKIGGTCTESMLKDSWDGLDIICESKTCDKYTYKCVSATQGEDCIADGGSNYANKYCAKDKTTKNKLGENGACNQVDEYKNNADNMCLSGKCIDGKCTKP